MLSFFFFFSSRRRHTRCSRDWSSDVCSSDLGEETGEIDQLMSEIADMYEREVTLEVEGLSAKAEPILLVCMGVLVLILALGVFLPMWDMASAARGVGGRGR